MWSNQSIFGVLEEAKQAKVLPKKVHVAHRQHLRQRLLLQQQQQQSVELWCSRGRVSAALPHGQLIVEKWNSSKLLNFSIHAYLRNHIVKSTNTVLFQLCARLNIQPIHYVSMKSSIIQVNFLKSTYFTYLQDNKKENFTSQAQKPGFWYRFIIWFFNTQKLFLS